MEPQVIKTNLLAIAVSGFLTMLAGIALYLFRGSIATNIRFLLQIPPLGVAAYIFAFNLFRFYNGSLPNMATTAKEIVVSTLISGGVFFIFTLLFVVIISFVDSLG